MHARLKLKKGGISVYWRNGDLMLQSDIQIVHFTPEQGQKLIELLYFAIEESYKENHPDAPTEPA